MKGAKATAGKTPAREAAAREVSLILLAGDSLSKAKHKQENKDAGDDKDLPKKKRKSGKWQQMGQQPHLKPKMGHRKRDAPVYAAGSLEEHWQLEILSRGRVTCPTCRAVARKTVEGLKKHMTNCQHEMLTCPHCGKQLRSLAGMKYHIMADHNSLISLLCQDIQPAPQKEVASAEPSSGGRRALRKSAQAAAHHLQEALAKEALAKEWPRRKVWQDLVPEDRKLKYTRPGLPAVSQEVLSKWRAEIKACRRVRCPNQGCECVYSSISGLKSHLGSCTLGEFVAGRYRCLLCEKEFVSESGVKYHINTVHAQDWFAVGTHPAKSFKKLLKQQSEEAEQKRAPRKPLPCGSRKKRPQTAASPKAATPRQEAAGEQGRQQAGSGSCEKEEEDGPPPLKLSHRRGRE
ncbi:zinc finger protein 512 isoform X5 [Lacerta agilis]|uniref:zinc finger protein 512 isoform X5 n=1 Tax=Lacerta agilis TaxID=80427 RepID=UPI00141A4090|nr:zinc finger protein 512 isoform X5 [Lacerta agilis]